MAMSKTTGRPPGSGGKPRALSAEDIRAVDAAIKGTRKEHRNRALFYLGLGSGLRIHEICALRIKDVRNHTGDIKSAIQLSAKRTKSKRARNVGLSPQAQYWLHDWLKRQPPSALEPNAPLFPATEIDPETGYYKHFPEDSAKKQIKAMFRLANVYGASSHSLRRTHANELRRKGVDLKLIQEQLGHSSLAITEKYFELDPFEITNAVAQLQFG